MLETLLANTDAALEAVPAPVIPHWHIEATYSGGIFPGYDGTDYTAARLALADLALATGTESVVIYRNGVLFRQLSMEKV